MVDKITVAVVLLIVALTLAIKRTSVKRPPYPPGPPPKFLLGNYLDFPQQQAYRTYKRWGQEYGDVIHLEAFGQHVIILNSQKASLDLLEKRSGIYSSRPNSPLLHASEWSVWNFAFMPYGVEWRIKRKIAQQYMRPDQLPRYEAIQIKRAQELIENLAKTPDDFLHHVRTASTGSIVSIVYDLDIASRDDPFVDLVDHSLRDMSSATIYPGSDVLNTIPIIPYLPSWLPFQRRLATARKSAYDMRATPFRGTLDALGRGVHNDSVVGALLAKAGNEKRRAEIIQDAAASLYLGGADTTPSSMGTFFLAMASNLQAQRAGQAEVDRITGGIRLPEFADRPNMPYVEAIVREIFRCGIVLPFSLQHATTTDDVYEGHFIPKDSVVVSNIWAINNDERTFEDPSEFRPERHLADDEASVIQGPGLDASESPLFGHGRRRCPGRYLADKNVWIAVAYILCSFDISPPTDGPPLDMNKHEYDEGIVFQPKPFRLNIQKRERRMAEE